jgi:DNA polymerase-3 subunit delta'
MSWRRVRGHDSVIQSFQRAVRRGRLAHAYLFTGPAGVGKHLFALELAKALLCEGQTRTDQLDSCDQCQSCVLVGAGTHPDLYQAVRPADAHEFPIELMRELCQSFALRSARGRGKVVIIEDADDLNAESANCFLKTLEEPPPGSVLILVGSSPDRQLPTVVSRCQVVRFAPLPAPVVEGLLVAQKIADADIRARLARLSGGSPGYARELASPTLWGFRRRLIDELARPKPNTVTLAREWMTLVEEAGKETAAQRNRARLILRLVVDFLADVLAASEGAAGSRTQNEDTPALNALVSRLDSEIVLALLERCLEADKQIERRVQLVLVLEGLLDALGQQLALGGKITKA